MTKNFRFENDSMGKIKVPVKALWGAQTQRSILNFSIGEELIPIELIYSITIIKKAAANANFKLGLIDKGKKDLIHEACNEIIDGKHDSQFPLKIWQTGSGTQTNMNINEVISNIAALKTNSGLGSHHPIHPNDDVNKSQSTNDTFPAAIQISVVNEIIKKCIFQGKPLNDETIFHCKRELGDIIWYWINSCRALGLDPNEVIEENVNKLKSRYPGGEFNVYHSENRKEGDL